jgi:hypothetical protein
VVPGLERAHALRRLAAIDLAGHLRCGAENYLEFPRDAPDSRPAKLFAQDAASAVLIRQQARQNAAELARAVGADHRPRDPDVLVSAWRWGVPHLPLASGDSWQAVLASSGRSPHWPALNGRAPRGGSRPLEVVSSLLARYSLVGPDTTGRSRALSLP